MKETGDNERREALGNEQNTGAHSKETPPAEQRAGPQKYKRDWPSSPQSSQRLQEVAYRAQVADQLAAKAADRAEKARLAEQAWSGKTGKSGTMADDQNRQGSEPLV